MSTLLFYPFGIPCTLSFVINPNVFGRCASLTAPILLQKSVNVLDKDRSRRISQPPDLAVCCAAIQFVQTRVNIIRRPIRRRRSCTEVLLIANEISSKCKWQGVHCAAILRFCRNFRQPGRARLGAIDMLDFKERRFILTNIRLHAYKTSDDAISSWMKQASTLSEPKLKVHHNLLEVQLCDAFADCCHVRHDHFRLALLLHHPLQAPKAISFQHSDITRGY